MRARCSLSCASAPSIRLDTCVGPMAATAGGCASTSACATSRSNRAAGRTPGALDGRAGDDGGGRGWGVAPVKSSATSASSRRPGLRECAGRPLDATAFRTAALDGARPVRVAPASLSLTACNTARLPAVDEWPALDAACSRERVSSRCFPTRASTAGDCRRLLLWCTGGGATVPAGTSRRCAAASNGITARSSPARAASWDSGTVVGSTIAACESWRQPAASSMFTPGHNATGCNTGNTSGNACAWRAGKRRAR